MSATSTAALSISSSVRERRGLEPSGATYDRVKRAFDVVAASVLLVFLLPVMLALYVWVRADGGPAFYGHERIGRDGRRFQCWKFRSMHVNGDIILAATLEACPKARAEWAQRQKLSHDPRVTAAGRLLRKSSLDELPQLFNVLGGTMSLIGPRPIVAAELLRYGHRGAAYLRCRPGITGLWQVSGRSRTTYARRVALDSVYAKRQGFLLDAHVLLKTVPVVLLRHGAE